MVKRGNKMKDAKGGSKTCGVIEKDDIKAKQNKTSSFKFQFHSTNAMKDKILHIHILPDLLKRNHKL